MRLVDIEGIGSGFREKLKAAGIDTTEELLQKAGSARGREALAEQTGISGKLILEWVNLADLARIKGIGEELSDLLEEAGVDSVAELAARKPENLHQKLVEVNDQKRLVRQVPSLTQVESFVEQAKQLPRVVTH